MQLDDLPVAIEQLRHSLDLAQQAFGITHTAADVARDDTITAAIKAGAEAVGDVQVKRERPRYRRLIGEPRICDEVRDAEVRGELRNTRIGCVARTRAVVASQQLSVEFR